MLNGLFKPLKAIGFDLRIPALFSENGHIRKFFYSMVKKNFKYFLAKQTKLTLKNHKRPHTKYRLKSYDSPYYKIHYHARPSL